MSRIFAIGGGEIGLEETLEIDRKIVAASGKVKPKVLFIPTASGDADGYVATFEKIYGDKLGCEVDSLLLIKEEMSFKEIEDKIFHADIVYVGGGNTREMMGIWKENKVDVVLKKAYQSGVIMSGLSAGSICWFEKGHSDSDTYEAGEIKPYSIVEGLGWFPIFHCPHYNEDDRAIDFADKIAKMGMVGFALDNHCCIEIHNEMFRIIRSDYMANAYKIVCENGVVSKEIVDNYEHFKAIEYLCM